MPVEHVHEGYIKARRLRVLQQHFLALLPPETASLLDVGTGDGQLVASLQKARPGLQVRGLETHLRGDEAIPVEAFDGRHLPTEAGSVDAVSFIDVLHHTEDPRALLLEAARVARRAIIIKDHVVTGLLARPTLSFMDWVGNARFGVSLPYNYQTRAQWEAHVAAMGWQVAAWETRLRLYPWWADWLFGRGLHCFVRLEPKA